jgi:acetyl-CoA C-acetyltransferase
MRKVAIIGIGQTRVTEHWEYPIRHLAVEALIHAMCDAGRYEVDSLYVGNMLSGRLSEQEHLGALIADYAGMTGIEAVKVEAACASAAAAFRQAVLAVSCGMKDSAAVVGVEKLTEFSGKYSAGSLATAADADYESSLGLSFVAINALMMRRYMHEYGVSKKDFSIFPIIAHQNASKNPSAMFRNQITAEQYDMAKMIADPINLLDSSPIADGAAALIVVPVDKINENAGIPVEVVACEIGTDTIAVDNREDPIWLKGVEISARRAYRTAEIQPGDLSFFEFHDAFSIISALSLEASGFSEAGKALHVALDGRFHIDGKMPVATMGGLKGRGHPVGATGVYQIVEAVLQLRGQAPEGLQVKDPVYGMTQNIGGSGATVVTSILKLLEK